MQINPVEWAHFLSTATGVIIGSIPGAGTVIVFIWKAMRKMDIFMVEHEMLIIDYADRKGIRVEDLPTRSSRFRH